MFWWKLDLYLYNIKIQIDINQNDINFMWGINIFFWKKDFFSIFFTGPNPAQPFWFGLVLSGLENKKNSGETLHCSFCRTVEVTEPKKKRKEEEGSGAANRAVALGLRTMALWWFFFFSSASPCFFFLWFFVFMFAAPYLASISYFLMLSSLSLLVSLLLFPFCF